MIRCSFAGYPKASHCPAQIELAFLDEQANVGYAYWQSRILSAKTEATGRVDKENHAVLSTRM